MIKTDEQLAAAKMTVAVGSAGLTALTLNEWVALMTIAYLLLQIGLLLPKYWQMFKEWRTRA